MCSRDRSTLRRMFDEKAFDGEGAPVFLGSLMVKKGLLWRDGDEYSLTPLGERALDRSIELKDLNQSGVGG